VQCRCTDILSQVVSEDILNSLKANGVAVAEGVALPDGAVLADGFEGRDVHDHSHDENEASLRAQGGDGFFCLDKVMNIEEIVYDEEVGNFWGFYYITNKNYDACYNRISGIAVYDNRAIVKDSKFASLLFIIQHFMAPTS